MKKVAQKPIDLFMKRAVLFGGGAIAAYVASEIIRLVWLVAQRHFFSVSQDDAAMRIFGMFGFMAILSILPLLVGFGMGYLATREKRRLTKLFNGVILALIALMADWLSLLVFPLGAFGGDDPSMPAQIAQFWMRYVALAVVVMMGVYYVKKRTQHALVNETVFYSAALLLLAGTIATMLVDSVLAGMDMKAPSNYGALKGNGFWVIGGVIFHAIMMFTAYYFSPLKALGSMQRIFDVWLSVTIFSVAMSVVSYAFADFTGDQNVVVLLTWLIALGYWLWYMRPRLMPLFNK